MLLQAISLHVLWKRYRWNGENTYCTRAAHPTFNQPKRRSMDKRIKFCKHETKLLSSHLRIRKTRHRGSDNLTGQNQIMNQEWHCTSKAIAQIMIVFISSIYDELKTRIWYFINVAVTRISCTTKCQQAHRARWSLLQVKCCSCSKGTLDFNQPGGDSWRQNLLAPIRPTWRTLSTERERSKSVSDFQFDSRSFEVSKHIGDHLRFDQELFTQNLARVDHCCASHRGPEPHAEQ